MKLTILMSPDTSPQLKEAWTGRALPLIQKKETEASEQMRLLHALERSCCMH